MANEYSAFRDQIAALNLVSAAESLFFRLGYVVDVVLVLQIFRGIARQTTKDAAI